MLRLDRGEEPAPEMEDRYHPGGELPQLNRLALGAQPNPALNSGRS